MNLTRVKNDSVWHSLKILFFAAPILFLINIFFGFDNVITVGELPRWQLLIHLHGGSIGWITLSAIGVAIWQVTGDRDVDRSYERKVRFLVWGAIIAFSGYVPSFGLAFSRPSGFLVALLPIFGISALTMFWANAIFALSQLRKQHPVNSVQLLISFGLLAGASGATVGALLGLERAIGQFLPFPPGADRVGAHAGAMDTYLFLVASAIVEWIISKDYRKRRTAGTIAQTALWTAGAIMIPISGFLGTDMILFPVFLGFLLIGAIIFLVRVGARAIFTGPFSEGVKPWASLGAAWLAIDMGTFLYLISLVMRGVDIADFPGWLSVLFAHAGFVGMMTNLLFGVLSIRTWARRDVVPWGDKTAMWLMNLGILVFVALKATSDSRLGAIVMGVGVLTGVYTFLMRLRAIGRRKAAEQAVSPPVAAS